MSSTSRMGCAVGSVLGLAVYKCGTSVSRNSHSARTSVATCPPVQAASSERLPCVQSSHKDAVTFQNFRMVLARHRMNSGAFQLRALLILHGATEVIYMQIQDGHLSRQGVVVAEPDLLRRDRVVLVDHRDGAVVEQLLECVLGVEVLRPADQVVLRQ